MYEMGQQNNTFICIDVYCEISSGISRSGARWDQEATNLQDQDTLIE